MTHLLTRDHARARARTNAPTALRSLSRTPGPTRPTRGIVAELYLVGRLRAILMTRRGEPAAIRARDLAVLLGLGRHDRYPERAIRQLVTVLINEGLPIGSTVTEPAGYFVVSSEDELQRCLANYSARARAIEDKGRALADAFRHGPGQLALISERE
jgi:hypothetical protein